MKITITVAGEPTISENTVQCSADVDVDSLDQAAVERLVHTARQFDAVVRHASHDAHDTNGGRPAVPNASRNVGAGGPGGSKRLATEKQVKAITAMAGRQEIDLGTVLQDRFGVSGPSALSILEASSLIDELKNSLLTT